MKYTTYIFIGVQWNFIYSLSTCKCKITSIIYEHYIHEPKVKSQVLNNPSIIHILLVYFKLICDLNPMFTNHRHSPYHLCFGSVSCFCYFVILNPNSAGLMMNIVTLSHTGPIGGWGWIDQGLSPPPFPSLELVIMTPKFTWTSPK